MIETLFRAFVVFQPFLWMWLLEDARFNFLNNPRVGLYFGYGAVCFVAWVQMANISIGFYSTDILSVYALMVWIGTWIIKSVFKYKFKDAVAISFLITFLNSWYWEGILHLWAIQENGMNLNQLFQLIHLLPALYFLIKWNFDVQGSTSHLMKGWIAAGFITFARMARVWRYLPIVFTEWNVTFMNRGLMNANRIICFYFLLKAIVRFGMPKKALERREEELPPYRPIF